MPKELVYNRDAISEHAETAIVEHIAIGWTKDRTAQIGVIQGPPVKIEIDGEVTADKGLWMDLDRGQINMLIRSLRKARDAAFGRDE